MSKICVVGTGYVGLVTGTCFADLGNQVICLDVDGNASKSNQGVMPIYEPGLEQLVDQNVRAGRLQFYNRVSIERLKASNFAFIAVGTPSGVDGEADLQYVRSAAESIIADWSISPDRGGQQVHRPGGHRRLGGRNHHANAGAAVRWIFSVVSNPEFLREGSAINDFMCPDRVVLGS